MSAWLAGWLVGCSQQSRPASQTGAGEEQTYLYLGKTLQLIKEQKQTLHRLADWLFV
jgi:hypothetical protein